MGAARLRRATFESRWRAYQLPVETFVAVLVAATAAGERIGVAGSAVCKVAGSGTKPLSGALPGVVPPALCVICWAVIERVLAGADATVAALGRRGATLLGLP